MEGMIERAQLLINQRKYKEAEKVLTGLLPEDPNDTTVLFLLSEVYLQQDEYEKALAIIDNAIGLSPDIPYLFYNKARVLIHMDKFDEAETNLKESIALDPEDADYFAMLATVKLQRKQFEEALELANQALELDAENLVALNTRGSALLKLDRKEESFLTIEGALREDPNNAYTHANYGWNLLEKGDHKKALVHFSEALKNDPNYDYAREGMMEALKANNFLYRLFLKYSFWMGNLSEKYQWGVIVGFYFGTKVLRGLANGNEALRPFLVPVIVLLALVAFSTWVITPISNLFLRFNKYGQHLLTRKQKLSSNFVGGSFLVLLAGVISYFISGSDLFLPVAIFGFGMMLPFGSMFAVTKYKHTMLIYAIAMSAVGILGIITTFLTGDMVNLFNTVFLFGFIAFQWISNFLAIRQDNV